MRLTLQVLTSIRSRDVVLLDREEIGAERYFARRCRLTRDSIRVRGFEILRHLGSWLLGLALSLTALREVRIHLWLMSLHKVMLLQLGVLVRALTFLGGG